MYTNNKFLRNLIFWLPAVLWAGLIFYLSSRTNVTPGWGIWDEIFSCSAHFIEYLILSFLLLRAFDNTTNLAIKTKYVFVVIIVILYAMSDEWHQSFIPTRIPSLFDIITDIMGAVVLLSYNKWKKIR